MTTRPVVDPKQLWPDLVPDEEPDFVLAQQFLDKAQASFKAKDHQGFSASRYLLCLALGVAPSSLI